MFPGSRTITIARVSGRLTVRETTSRAGMHMDAGTEGGEQVPERYRRLLGKDNP